MTFRKKDKPKKKSKKNKSKDRDEWAFDGGSRVSKDSSDPDQSKEIRRGPRKTQERDERFRRSLMKHEERKRKNEFSNKMSKKLKFSDVLKEEGEIKVEETVEDKQVSVKEVRRNLIPAADRLRMLMVRSIHGYEQISSNNDDDLSDRTSSTNDDDVNVDNDDEEQVSYDSEIPDNSINDDNSSIHDDHDNIEDTHDESTNDDEYNYDDAQNNSEVFSQFFLESEIINSSKSASKSLKQLTAVSKNLTLFGSQDVKVPNPSSFSKLRDIPSLHKLWSSRASNKLSSIESKLLPYICNYSDALIEGLSKETEEDILRSTLLHICLHTVRARALILKHNQRIKRKTIESKISSIIPDASSKPLKEKKKSKQSQPADINKPIAMTLASDDDHEAAYHDQGYCRPKVLILCPFRWVALQCVEMIKDIFGNNTTVANEQKLVDEYSNLDDDEDAKKASIANRLPDDWKHMFHDKNTDDDFKFGIQVNVGQGKGSGPDKGVYLRLFSDFMISDIIIASPLGLRFIIENNGITKKSDSQPVSGSDILSSLEIVLLHQADVVSMQNWDHVEYIFQNINKMPTTLHDKVDFSRIRRYFLEAGQSQYHRQLILTSAFVEPEIQAFFRLHATSKNGHLRVKKNWEANSSEGEIDMSLPLFQVSGQIHQQLFRRINSVSQNSLASNIESVESIEEERFKYFVNKVLKPLIRGEQSGVLIITPKYFDYVRVRNELLRLEADAAFICEYSRESEISRGRSKFFHGLKKIMLYSGRAHFFRRFNIRGAKQVIFYSLPEYPHYYPELVNYMIQSRASAVEDGNSSPGPSEGFDSKLSSLALFSAYEQMALERIVGKKRCQHMISSEKETFMFK